MNESFPTSSAEEVPKEAKDDATIIFLKKRIKALEEVAGEDSGPGYHDRGEEDEQIGGELGQLKELLKKYEEKRAGGMSDKLAA